MKGHVDGSGRALIVVPASSPAVAETRELEAWIDTGFTGELVLPQETIDGLALSPSATVKAILADGSETTLQTYTCLIDWFGERRQVEVVANDGAYPLLGVGLLLGRELRISYVTGEIEIG